MTKASGSSVILEPPQTPGLFMDGGVVRSLQQVREAHASRSAARTTPLSSRISFASSTYFGRCVRIRFSRNCGLPESSQNQLVLRQVPQYRAVSPELVEHAELFHRLIPFNRFVFESVRTSGSTSFTACLACRRSTPDSKDMKG